LANLVHNLLILEFAALGACMVLVQSA
jgi:hypothetical protein